MPGTKRPLRGAAETKTDTRMGVTQAEVDRLQRMVLQQLYDDLKCTPRTDSDANSVVQESPASSASLASQAIQDSRTQQHGKSGKQRVRVVQKLAVYTGDVCAKGLACPEMVPVLPPSKQKQCHHCVQPDQHKGSAKSDDHCPDLYMQGWNIQVCHRFVQHQIDLKKLRGSYCF